MPSLSYFFEKVALVMCTSLLIFQIYLSWKTFIQEDYVETKSEEKLYNVDLPMMICAKIPSLIGLTWVWVGTAMANLLGGPKRTPQCKKFSDPGLE